MAVQRRTPHRTFTRLRDHEVVEIAENPPTGLLKQRRVGGIRGEDSPDRSDIRPGRPAHRHDVESIPHEPDSTTTDVSERCEHRHERMLVASTRRCRMWTHDHRELVAASAEKAPPPVPGDQLTSRQCGSGDGRFALAGSVSAGGPQASAIRMVDRQLPGLRWLRPRPRRVDDLRQPHQRWLVRPSGPRRRGQRFRRREGHAAEAAGLMAWYLRGGLFDKFDSFERATAFDIALREQWDRFLHSGIWQVGAGSWRR